MLINETFMLYKVTYSINEYKRTTFNEPRQEHTYILAGDLEEVQKVFDYFFEDNEEKNFWFSITNVELITEGDTCVLFDEESVLMHLSHGVGGDTPTQND